jgi:hypothetical protein
MSDIQATPKDTSARRKLIAAIGVFSLLPILQLGWFNKKKEVIGCAPETTKKTIKFLTQDGTLVEVDASRVSMGKEKISNKQLQSWVKKEL